MLLLVSSIVYGVIFFGSLAFLGSAVVMNIKKGRKASSDLPKKGDQ